MFALWVVSLCSGLVRAIQPKKQAPKNSNRRLPMVPIHRIVKANRTPQYLDPIDVNTGEIVVLGKTDPEWPGWQWCTDGRGKSGWVPIEWIEARGNACGIIKHPYTARELPIS